MRIAHKLVPLAVTVVVGMAFMAPSALAVGVSSHDGVSTEPELHDQASDLQVRAEPDGSLCAAVTPAASTNPSPTLTAGGCRIHVTGNEIRVSVHLSAAQEMDVSVCDVEFDVRVDSAGEGWVVHQEFTDDTPGSCTRQPCASNPPDAEAKAWGLHMRETGSVGPRELATMLLCLADQAGGQSHCEIDLIVLETSNHRYAVLGGPGCHQPANTFPRTEITGRVDTEAVLGTTGESQTEQQIEINHLPPFSVHDGASVEPELHNQFPELQVRAEPVGGLCPSVNPVSSTVPAPHVTSGGCRFHVGGTGIRLIAHLSDATEVDATRCNFEFHARIDSAGEGWITHQEITDAFSPGDCTRRPCPELPEPTPPAESKAWGFYLREPGPVAPTETATMLLCLAHSSNPHLTPLYCEIEIPFTETSNHQYRLDAQPGTGGAACHGGGFERPEISGEFTTETLTGTTEENQAEQKVEINHI